MAKRYNIDPQKIPAEAVVAALEVASKSVSRMQGTPADEHARKVGDFVNVLLGRVYNVRQINDLSSEDSDS